MAYDFTKSSKISMSEGTLKKDGSAILLVFVGVLLAIAFLMPSSDQVYTDTTTHNIANATLNSANGTYDLLGKSISNLVIYNGTNTKIITTENYTIKNYVNVNGDPTAQIVIAAQNIYQGQAWNVSYTYEPRGYVGTGSNSVMKIIIIMGALGILVFAVVVFIKKGSLSRLLNK